MLALLDSLRQALGALRRLARRLAVTAAWLPTYRDNSRNSYTEHTRPSRRRRERLCNCMASASSEYRDPAPKFRDWWGAGRDCCETADSRPGHCICIRVSARRDGLMARLPSPDAALDAAEQTPCKPSWVGQSRTSFAVTRLLDSTRSRALKWRPRPPHAFRRSRPHHFVGEGKFFCDD